MERVRLLGSGDKPHRILALGAHPDDIEIGCGGTILRLIAERPGLEVLWVVFAAKPERGTEACASVDAFLQGVPTATVVVRDYRDGFLPYSGAAVKDEFEALKREFSPDLVLTHYREDRHQDHRLVSELTWNTWRDLLNGVSIEQVDRALDPGVARVRGAQGVACCTPNSLGSLLQERGWPTMASVVTKEVAAPLADQGVRLLPLSRVLRELGKRRPDGRNRHTKTVR
jgi:LmbE family N-acetylglucosaminyl deacetylase